LALVKLVAQAHHGRLWVESRPGGGSIFILTIGNSDPAS
jgi:signal transduction histidine kinase